MTIDDLLHRLQTQLGQLRARIAPLAQHASLSARFDRQLFRARGTRMQDYLDEAEENFARLRQAVASGHPPQVAWLAEHLAAQMEAIDRESVSWTLRQWDISSPALTRWQRKRLQTQEYERRLVEMRHQRRQRLAGEEAPAERQRLAREVATFDGRIERCRNALRVIESAIARLTR